MLAAAILLGLAANIDNLTIGIAYGVQRRRIRVRHNLLIGIVTTAVTGLAFAFGQALHRYLLAMLPGWLSGAMLIAMALFGLLRSQARPGHALHAGIAAWPEIACLALALSVNNVGLAIAGGFAGVGYAAALAAILGFSLALLPLGQAIGRHAGHRLDAALMQPWIGHAVLLLAGVMLLFGI